LIVIWSADFKNYFAKGWAGFIRANLTQGLSTIWQVSTAGFANPPMVLAQYSSSKW